MKKNANNGEKMAEIEATNTYTPSPICHCSRVTHSYGDGLSRERRAYVRQMTCC